VGYCRMGGGVSHGTGRYPSELITGTANVRSQTVWGTGKGKDVMQGILKAVVFLFIGTLVIAPLNATAATSVYPEDGAAGADGNLDGVDGFQDAGRQLDFDFTLGLLDALIDDFFDQWDDPVDPIWDDIPGQDGPFLGGAVDNDDNGIDDADQLDFFAAVYDEGTNAAPGLLAGDITAIQNAFDNNKTAIQNFELFLDRVTIRLNNSGGLELFDDPVTTGTTLSVFGQNIDIPSLWTINEDFNSGARGVIALAGDMLEESLLDLFSARAAISPSDVSNEINYVRNFLDTFLTGFIDTALEDILSDAGDVSNFMKDPVTGDITLNVAVDVGFTLNLWVLVRGTTITNGIDTFAGNFDCINLTCLSGPGSPAASGNLNRAGNTNLASYTASSTRQQFMANEGITNPPLQFFPVIMAASGVQDGPTVLGDDEWVIRGGDGTMQAFDWETVDPLEYTLTDPALGGDTGSANYSLSPTPASAAGNYSMQAADDTWTRTHPAFALSITNSPPTVEDVTVPSENTVVVTFDKLIDAGGTTAANYAVSGSGRGTLSTNPDNVAQTGTFEYTLTWNAPDEMLDGGNIRITVSNVQDPSGQAIGSPNQDLCSGCGIGTAPTLTDILTQDSGPTNTDPLPYSVTFDEDVMGVSDANFSVVTVSGSAGGSVSPTVGGSGASRRMRGTAAALSQWFWVSTC